MAQVLVEWPRTNDSEVQFRAVNGAMNNLLGYPHGRDDVWDEHVSVDRQQLREMFWRIREYSGANDGTRDYLKGELGRRSLLSDDALLRQRATIEALVESAGRYDVAIPVRLTRTVAAWNGTESNPSGQPAG